MSENITRHVEILKEAFGRMDPRGPNKGSQFLMLKSAADLIQSEIDELEQTAWMMTTETDAMHQAVELLKKGAFIETKRAC